MCTHCGGGPPARVQCWVHMMDYVDIFWVDDATMANVHGATSAKLASLVGDGIADNQGALERIRRRHGGGGKSDQEIGSD